MTWMNRANTAIAASTPRTIRCTPIHPITRITTITTLPVLRQRVFRRRTSLPGATVVDLHSKGPSLHPKPKGLRKVSTAVTSATRKA